MNKLYVGIGVISLAFCVSLIKKKPKIVKEEVENHIKPKIVKEEIENHIKQKNVDGIEHCFNPKDLFKKLLNDRNIKYKDSYEKIITKHGIIETKTQIVKFNNIGDDEFNHNLLTKVMTDFINKIGSSDVVYLHDILFSNEYDENIGCYIYKLEYNLYIQKNN